MLDSIPDVEPKTLNEMYPKAAQDAVDLMKKLLQFNPEKRITADEALNHPFVSLFHNPADEPNCPHPIRLYFNDNKKYSINEYREKLYQEIRKKRERRRLKHGEKDGTPASDKPAKDAKTDVAKDAKPAAAATTTTTTAAKKPTVK